MNTGFLRASLASIVLCLTLTLSPAFAAPPTPVATGKELGLPYDRYQSTDSLGRKVTWYLSTPPADAKGPLPLAVFIQGSGGGSLFTKAEDGRIGGGVFNLLLRDWGGRCRVLLVEKIGVNFLDQPPHLGAAEGCSDEFKREHTPERFTAAIVAAINAALDMPAISRDTLLVIGHSEGGDMAAHVAAADPRVTHCAVLSSGGPTQLFDMAFFARKPRSEGESLADRESRVEEVYKTWDDIMKDPDSIEKSAWGHPYRRWSSFCRTSPLDSMLKTKARLYMAYGTEDMAVPVESCDMARAELVRVGRDLTVERRIGEDHGFSKEGQTPLDGFTIVFRNVEKWWLGEKQK